MHLHHSEMNVTSRNRNGYQMKLRKKSVENPKSNTFPQKIIWLMIASPFFLI